MAEESGPAIISGQNCPMCFKDTLTLMEDEREVPYFGKAYIFSMNCSNCKYHKADVETESGNDPVKYTLDVNCEEDMSIRIIKSADATVKIPRIMSIEPGAASNGYITNVEGIFNRAKVQIENIRDNAEDKAERKKAKNLLKKIQDIMWGNESIKLTIEDPSGNSAIISDKAEKTSYKPKK
jgi:zinc finger protein